MNVLVINAGSSSLKYQLIEMTDESVLAKGIVERIGAEGTVLKHTKIGNDKVEIFKSVGDHTGAIKFVVDTLLDEKLGVLSSMDEISAVGHRVVHGGENYASSVIITDKVIKEIGDCAEFAPLHSPANLMGINACKKIMPNTPMVVVFDTAFHQTIPKKAYIYGLPYEAYSEMRIRKYGFHGTSHSYIANRTAHLLGKDVSELKIVTCHLGNGASVAAVDRGKSIDTSMGFTPLEGLIMGTRCGSIDPAIIEFIMNKKGYDIKQVVNYMNKESGVLGLSGVSSDFRDLWIEGKKGNERCMLALEAFCYGVKKYIGAYAAAMGGIDAISISAGIGENDPGVREMITSGLEFLGAKFDPSVNYFYGEEHRISTDDSKVAIFCIMTDEELKIARETKALCQ
jgi:acetate kinase